MTTLTERTITHPDWCHPLVCTAQPDEDYDYVHGNHRRYLDGFLTIWGSKVELHLTQEAANEQNANKGTSRRSYRISMITLAHEDDVPVELRGAIGEDEWRREHGERTDLEPEEARMLARFLTNAADEWERISVT